MGLALIAPSLGEPWRYMGEVLLVAACLKTYHHTSYF